ncbi:uncharacterized protein ACWYII_041005 isoform 1-T3 [Salvelinus alpinus]
MVVEYQDENDRTSSSSPSLSEVEVPPELQHREQEKSPSLGQEDTEPTQIKEEQGELGPCQEEEQNSHTIEFILTPVPVKSDCDEDPTQPSHLYQAPKEGNREGDTLPNTTIEQIKTEPGWRRLQRMRTNQ